MVEAGARPARVIAGAELAGGARVRIAVVGLGHIGLPLAVQYASRGHAVIGCDINPRIVDASQCAVARPHDDEPAPARAASRGWSRRAACGATTDDRGGGARRRRWWS